MSDPLIDYEAARSSAALFDLGQRTQIELTGDDRVTFLNNFCTNDITKLSPGEGCEAFLTSIKGRVLGHLFVFVEEASLWIDTVAGYEDAIIEHLDRYLITEDAELHRRSADYRALFVTGPQAIPRLQAAGFEIDLPAAFAHGRATVAGSEIHAWRVDWFDTPGVLLTIPTDGFESVLNQLAENDLHPGSETAFEVLRIEARFPMYGCDITDDNLAQEVARSNRAISFTKGCYLGQEPIARIDAMGHVNRKLRGLRLETGPTPSPGDRIVDPEEGKEIGTVTSSARLSDDHLPVALGYVRSKFVAPETRVQVNVGDDSITATVFV